MHAAQHLPERKIEGAQTCLTGRRLVFVLIIVRVPFVVKAVRVVCMCVTAGMPRGMHERTLLRNQQQEYAKVMEKPARHQGFGLKLARSRQTQWAIIWRSSAPRR